MNPRCWPRTATLLALAALLASCAGLSPPAPSADAGAWHDVPLPGKARTEYRWESSSGRRELVARADGSASERRRHVRRPADRVGDVEFGWWAQALPEGADLSEPGKTDAAARVMFAFDGDASRLSARTRAQSDLARMLTGEALPYATLVYVWDATAPVGTVITHPRNDRIRKIVVESGHGSLKQWRRYRRSLAADYQLAFGEPPGPLMAVAVMTDGDNTQSRLVTRYSDVEFR
jgi:Protein of unknown function (DUF3047)